MKLLICFLTVTLGVYTNAGLVWSPYENMEVEYQGFGERHVPENGYYYLPMGSHFGKRSTFLDESNLVADQEDGQRFVPGNWISGGSRAIRSPERIRTARITKKSKE